jgi:hypothetical protein
MPWNNICNIWRKVHAIIRFTVFRNVTKRMLWASAASLLRAEYLYMTETRNLSTHRRGNPKIYVDVTSFVKDVLAYVEKGGGSKAIPVRDRGGLSSCETSRLPHFVDNRLTDGGEVISLTRRPPFTPGWFFWYSFLLEAISRSLAA